MSDLKAKMYPNRFRLGLHARPRWELTAPPDLLAGFKGLASIRGAEGEE